MILFFRHFTSCSRTHPEHSRFLLPLQHSVVHIFQNNVLITEFYCITKDIYSVSAKGAEQSSF